MTVALVATLVTAGCGSSARSSAPLPSSAVPGPSTMPTGNSEVAATPAASSPGPSFPTSGFVFAADDIVAYYEGQGYRCTGPQPSAKALGYLVRGCELVDPAGRTRRLGLVTDAGGGLGNAFASVQAPPGEEVLEPVDALDPLAGVLGATLGAEQSGGLLEWLAGHLGDVHAETSVGVLRIATYSESADDHSRLYLEIADPAYLAAPAPPPQP